jgi:hypothetical protein
LPTQRDARHTEPRKDRCEIKSIEENDKHCLKMITQAIANLYTYYEVLFLYGNFNNIDDIFLTFLKIQKFENVEFLAI